MGTVKYSGPVASFHCPTEATIRSLKVHFSPKQEDSGDPSPENVRPIVGWDGVEVEQRGKNLFDANNPNIISRNCWVSSNTPHNIIASNVDRTVYIKCLPNMTYVISKTLGNVLGAGYTTELPVIGIQTYSYMRDNSAKQVTVTTGADAKYLAIWFYDGSKTYDRTVQPEDIYKTLQVEIGSTATSYEPYHGSTTNYEFGVLGKNKFNWDVPVSESSPVASDATTAREFTLNTYVIGMSVNNYYRQNYANWVLNPSVENGVISFSSGGASGYGIAFPLKLVAGQTYFLSGTGDGSAGATYYDRNGELISYQNGRLNKTITVPENTATTLIGFYASTSNTEFTFSDIQLELGSTATAYEPYDPNKTVYGGWVDLITGEVCEEYWKVTLDGVTTNCKANRDYSTNTHIVGGVVYLSPNGIADKQFTTELFCDNMPILAPRQTVPSVYPYIKTISAGDQYLRIYTDSATNHPELDTAQKRIDFVNEYLSEHPSSVAYKLKYPNTYYIATTQLQTFLSHNNVWSNADYIEVEYDLHETQNILARKQFIIANQPHIVKPAAAPLQNFVTDMVAPLKECKVHFSPVQDTSNGAPSPDNVCPISGWTELEVTQCGKNFSTAATGTEMAQKWPFNNNSSSRELLITGMQPKQEFTLSASFTKASEPSSNKRLYLVGSQKANSISNEIFQGPLADGPHDAVIHNWVDTDGTIKIMHNNRGLTYNDDFIEYAASLQNIQLELGDTATPFEPYNGTTIPITFPSEAGTIYGGYVDLIKGEVIKEWETVKIADLNWYNYSGKIHYYAVLPLRERNTYIYTDTLTPRTTGSFTQENVGELTYYGEGTTVTYKYIWTKVPEAMEITEANEWIKNTYANAVICYKLETPIHYSLTPTQLKTLRGTNNVWSSAGDITLSYWKH